MIVAIIVLTIAAFCASMYIKYKHARAFEQDVALGKELARIDALKTAIKQSQKELDDAGKNFNNLYDAYERKYHPSERDPK